MAQGNAFTIELANGASFLARFKMRRAGLALQAKRLEKEIAGEIAEAARDFVAVDTGRTKENIRVGRRMGGTAVIADRGGVRPEVPIYLELGTYKMAARPFLKPAADLVMASRGLRRAVTRVGGLLPPVT